MTNKLEALRKALLEKEAKTNSSFTKSTEPSPIYPFWNTPAGKTSLIRLLPDGDPNNTFFWVERLVINLTFGDGVRAQVPCLEMWDEKCPILEEVRTWFKDPSKEQVARSYWKKRSYLFQGFVVADGVGETEKPENPIRRFVVNKTLFETIKAALMDADMEDLPIDYEKGRDFRITVTKRGDYKDYATSGWSMRSRGLTDQEKQAIEKYGLFDLKTYLPKKPDPALITEMFRASVAGEDWCQDWGRFFTPSTKGVVQVSEIFPGEVSLDRMKRKNT
ncbi:hypothetical protein DF3PA_70108 [Candidatus Defluviicoccus seviourii]|uniref:Bacteriophage T4 Gp32 single-stranded DNA-binding domain-containing protein n=1 Tax=Candidatus Defluviicoccus seviourii TaxID=2565273 RepID=A0A564WH32_9PROT|nr:hypothetical protein DF3PA_70108 [Candidatus Defluviicoccus seviourii]